MLKLTTKKAATYMTPSGGPFVAKPADVPTGTALHWVKQTFPVSSEIFRLSNANEYYFAITSDEQIFRSTDAKNWTSYTSPFTVMGYPWGTPKPIGYAYGNGVYVGVSQTWGGIVTSSDGLNWTLTYLNTNEQQNAVYFCNDRFIVCGVGALLISTDGVNWTKRTTGAYMHCATYGNGYYMAGGENKLLMSTDTVTWTPKTLPNNNGYFNIRGVDASIPDNFVAIGGMTGWPRECAWQSDDGITWTTIAGMHGINIYAEYRNLAYGNGVLVASGTGTINGIVGSIFTTKDGILWAQNSAGVSYRNEALCYSAKDKQFVLGGQNGIYTSID